MTPERWKRLSDLFEGALDLTPAERPAFLARACADDAALRSEVERLLESDERAGLSAQAAFRLSTAPTAPTLQPGAHLGRYEIKEFVGAGGMGEVYRAHDPRLDRQVGIKILLGGPEVTDDQLARFEREARAVAALNHPNILSVFDIGVQDGLPFVVSELLGGETLRARLERGPLPSGEVLHLARQIVAGLAAAHGRGIVHRDIKPENLFVTPDRRLKILDFGLAKQSILTGAASGATTLTGEGLILGTAGYMAPEQVRGQPADARTDIFAVGAVLYEMVTGRRAFAGDSAIDTMSAILTTEPPALADLPAPWRAVVSRCLHKDPERRYPSMHELASAVERPVSTASELEAPYGNRRVLLAVLPFANVSGDAAQEYFSDGLTDEMIAQLGRVNPHRLGVIARTSAMKYKQLPKSIDVVGRELGVSYVLEGSVRRSGNRVRVTTRLVQVSDQSHVWAETYDRDVGDLLALQTDLAQAIAGEIRVQLTPQARDRVAQQRPPDPAAHDAYLAGRYFWGRRSRKSLEKSIACFQQAIDIDPGYAAAHAGLADAYLTQLDYNHRPPREAAALAERTIAEALRLDDTLAEPHSSLGHLRLHQFDFQAAEVQFLRALELDPGCGTAHYYYGNLLSALGRFDEGLTEAARAIEIDPLTPNTRLNRVFILYLARRYDDAIKELREILERDPTQTAPSYLLGLVYERQRKYAEAIAELQRVGPDSPRGTTVLAAVGFTHAVAGQRADALEVLRRLDAAAATEYVSSYDLALLHMAVGDTDRACALLWQAYEDHSSFLPYVNVDARFDRLRSEPRVQALIDRLHHPERKPRVGFRMATPRRVPAIAALGALAVLTAAGMGLFLGGQPAGTPAGSSARQAVAILALDNPTRDAALDWLTTGVADMLSIGLAETPSIDVLSSRRTAELLRGGDQPNAGANRGQAFELVREAGAGAVVGGAVYRSGDDIRLDVQVEDLATSRLIAATSVRGPDVFALVDELVGRLRAALRVDEQPAGRGITEITTHSLEAYRLYTEGYAAIRGLRTTDARRALEAALRLDPGYALAHVALSEAFEKLGDQRRAAEHIVRAKGLATRLPERDRLLVDAREAVFLGQTERAIRTLEAFVSQWPAEDTPWDVMMHAYSHDPVLAPRKFDVLERWRKAVPGPGAGHMHNHFGYAYLEAGRLDDALASFEAYRRVSPHEPNAHDSYGEVLLAAARPREAIDSYARALAIDPSFGISHIGRSWGLGMEGRFDEALAGLAALESLGERGGLGWRHVHFMQAILASRAGRYRDAFATIDRGLEVARNLDSMVMIVELHLAAARLALESGQASRARANAEEALTLLDSDPERLELHLDRALFRSFGRYLLGVADIRAGRLAAAEDRLEAERADGRVPDSVQVWLQHALAGEIAFARGDLASAERLWRAGIPARKMSFSVVHAVAVFAHELPQRNWEARIQHARGNLSGAAATYAALNTVSRETPWTALIEPRFVLERARLLDRAGNATGARAEYARFLELWMNADDTLPELAEARRYLRTAGAPPR